MKSKKIYINKNDDIAAVVSKVVAADANHVVLSVPKFSLLGSTPAHFALLKKESESAKKKLLIESVDDAVVELAMAEGIAAANPFFVRPDGKLIDIMPTRVIATSARIRSISAEPPLKVEHKSHIKVVSAPPATPKVDTTDDDLADVEKEAAAELEAKFGPVDEPKPKNSKAYTLAALVVLAFSGALSYVAFFVLPQAEIDIVPEKKSFSFDNSILVDKTIQLADASALKIPGQVFAEKRNVSLAFPASGKKQVSKKATGKLTIYNAYSSDRQVLVAATRFATTDGKIFRLTQTVTVPGAKIVDGKIVPSSIDASVIADKAGVEGNMGPVSRWIIPGLKGGPRYEAFYGVSSEPMAGGFVGETAYPTDVDISKAKATLAETLQNGASAALLQKIPKEFKVADGNAQFTILRQTVGADANEQGLFTVYGEGEMKAMAFREADVQAILKQKMTEGIGADFDVKTQSLAYGKSSTDFAAGKMNLAVQFNAQLARRLNISDLRSKTLRKSESELKAILLSLSGLESAKISLWPFWVRSVPSREDKVNIKVEKNQLASWLAF